VFGDVAPCTRHPYEALTAPQGLTYAPASDRGTAARLVGRRRDDRSCPVNNSHAALLRRMATVNIAMGEIIRQMLNHAEDGHLRSGDLRSIGQDLASLGADMVRRADEMDRVQVITSDGTT
jgi:hypothetical protein